MDEEMFQEHITVDLTGCKYVMEFWERVRLAFVLDDLFGKNWDALWDMLSWECPANKVTIIGANTLPKSWQALDGRTYPEKIERILQRAKEDRKNITTNLIMNSSTHKLSFPHASRAPAVNRMRSTGQLRSSQYTKLAGH